MSLINTSCILQKADSEFYVKYQDSVLEVKRGRLEIALLPGLRVICRTCSLSVSGILPEKMLCILRINLIRPWLSTQMYLDVVSLATHITEIFSSRILCATITEI